MLELESALEKILAALPPAEGEDIPLAQAHGRVLMERILSTVDLPLFDNSAMDGYAARSEDLKGAAPESSVQLRLLGKVAAGQMFAEEVKAGTCVRLFTGSPVPRGADSVIMQEDTRLDPACPGAVSFLDCPKPWENVRLQGEDLKRGAMVVEAGGILNPGRLGLLAAVGVMRVRVGRQPRVGLLASGSELVEGGQPLFPGAIYESNRLALSALIARAGGVSRVFPLVRDTLTETRRALEQALTECDMVVTSGGVSVGEMDFIKTAFEELGGQLQFWKVAIKPGRPFAFGRWKKSFLFGLPGNPVSAFVTFLLLVRPALARWQGAMDTTLPAHPGILAEPLANPGNRRHFMRVRVDQSGKVRSTGAQASHILTSLAEANGLVDMPPQTTLESGSTVPVLRWD
ncbi:MAG TPA: gephyrin-like molybdotransferase Glp [Verrucomicrobiae bacterium]|nr:gephyrin-like molybdotransferase Glp [Verrucomicrobiae bacterium]